MLAASGCFSFTNCRSSLSRFSASLLPPFFACLSLRVNSVASLAEACLDVVDGLAVESAAGANACAEELEEKFEAKRAVGGNLVVGVGEDSQVELGVGRALGPGGAIARRKNFFGVECEAFVTAPLTAEAKAALSLEICNMEYFVLLMLPTSLAQTNSNPPRLLS